MSIQEKSQFKSMLTKASDIYFPMIQRQLEDNSIEMDDYAKKCVMNSISAINETLDIAGVRWNDKQLDQSNLTEILLSVASLKLNASASPNEVYFQIRNVKRKEKGKDIWKKQIELGIEGDGNDAILARFGRDVKQVMKFWEVRENDKFEYPMFNGLEMTPPKWQPTGQGKVVRVVYPLIKRNDIIEYHIAERADVIRNLIAHVNNNLMRETFGIAKDTYSATPAQRKEINDKKQEILTKVDDLGIDNALDNPELQKYISPAWKSLQSRESMLIRKMRNNVVKKIPKDFGSVIAELSFDKSSNFDENIINQEVNNNANREMIDFSDDDETEEAEYKEVNTENEASRKKSDVIIEGEYTDLKEKESKTGSENKKQDEFKGEKQKEVETQAEERKTQKTVSNEEAEQLDFSQDDVPF